MICDLHSSAERYYLSKLRKIWKKTSNMDSRLKYLARYEGNE